MDSSLKPPFEETWWHQNTNCCVYVFKVYYLLKGLVECYAFCLAKKPWKHHDGPWEANFWNDVVVVCCSFKDVGESPPSSKLGPSPIVNSNDSFAGWFSINRIFILDKVGMFNTWMWTHPSIPGSTWDYCIFSRTCRMQTFKMARLKNHLQSDTSRGPYNSSSREPLFHTTYNWFLGPIFLGKLYRPFPAGGSP